jgi:probable F420-dependent oxidoreductase
MFANTGAGSSTQGALGVAKAAEAAGYESLWTVEHVVVPSGYKSAYPYDPSGKMAGGAEEFDLPDPLMWLAFVASATERIKLATGILIVPQRNPVVLAKELATLDHLSGGRVVLGVGAGWLAEEFDAIGVPFNERGARLDDHIETMRALWHGGKVTVDGRFTQFKDCISLPRPANGTIPIVVGGHSLPAARRAGRLGDGFFPAGGSVDDLRHLIATVKESAFEAGRDPDAIEFSSGGGAKADDAALARYEALADIGVTRIVVPGGPPEKVAALGEALISRLGDS